jgi:3-hydroxybutyryl-CoA dehydrogenase
MRILIVGDADHVAECKQKLGSSHSYSTLEDHSQLSKNIKGKDVVFDFLIDYEFEEFQNYVDAPCPIFLNTAKISLAELSNTVENNINASVFGFNGLPTFFNLPLLEVSVLKKEHLQKLEEMAKLFETQFIVVDDRVGLVTPRVICMIINEAYYTVQEGTASREDIDTAMKLGTNYPFGPFEWCQRIGIRNVYELLEAVYDDTKDERYKICPLLKREYLLSE